jgi:hypothetical protein
MRSHGHYSSLIFHLPVLAIRSAFMDVGSMLTQYVKSILFFLSVLGRRRKGEIKNLAAPLEVLFFQHSRTLTPLREGEKVLLAKPVRSMGPPALLSPTWGQARSPCFCF